MILQEPGPISEHLIFLGDNRVCMYLLMGEKYLLLGGGMSYVVPMIEEQLDYFGIDCSRILGLLILHSHFDHCTAAPYFKKAYPDWAIMASAGTKKVFGMEKKGQSLMSQNLKKLFEPIRIGSFELKNRYVLKDKVGDCWKGIVEAILM